MYNSFKLEREINFLLNDSTFSIATPIYIDIIIIPDISNIFKFEIFNIILLKSSIFKKYSFNSIFSFDFTSSDNSLIFSSSI